MPMTGAEFGRKSSLEATLRRRIISMEIAPGSVVDELSLGHEFGLSRPPVREIMRTLAVEGYIVLEQNRPARVTAMNYQALHSFFLAAPLIYTAVSLLAATHATKEQLQELKNIQQHLRQSMVSNDTNARVYYNNQFHYMIGVMSYNDYLLASLQRLLIDHARLAHTFYSAQSALGHKEDMDKAIAHHDQIITAIENRDSQKVEQLVREHWELSRQHLMEYVIPDEA
ncbi:GntR family transcriptional regulator [Carnimonas nigrificans]|uniref:GntR family transcriptional regulator n=1 Tax=Carnimonas nigrificans TaxID=64323 RepID=UPI0005595C32|nr:GntR family transcriptional regulator [Carnimonas nigrificans]